MEKTIYVENGIGAVALRIGGGCSYLNILKPAVLDWYDQSGSLGKYFAIFSALNDDPFRDYDLLTQGLNFGAFDFEVHQSPLLDFLSLFENGTYNIRVTRLDDDWQFVQNFQNYNSVPAVREANREAVPNSKFSNSIVCENYYDGQWPNFVATQPVHIMDVERIQHYEELINSGVTPLPLIFCGRGQNLDSANFVLDGHHKLQAYRNLRKLPKALWVTQHIDEQNFSLHELESDVRPRLLKCQYDHIIKHWRWD